MTKGSVMYIANQIKRVRVTWTEIVIHTYVRVSRSKWTIQMNYACGAEMFLENQPDDLIQCLILGAYNSNKAIESEHFQIAADAPRQTPPPTSWRELQDLLMNDD